MKHIRRNENSWIFIIGAILILSVIFTTVMQMNQNELDVYTQSDKVAEKETEQKEESEPINTFIYTNNENNLSMEIPEGWERVTQDGYDTFIHSASGSSVQVQIKEYSPEINNMTAETASIQVADEGKTFVSFDKTSDTSYELLYQDMSNSTYDYIEETYWDREKIITLKCIFNDQNYEKITPYYDEIFSSFAWERQDPVPEGYYLYYSEEANCEFGIPSTWNFGESQGAVYASDSVSGASLTATSQAYSSYLDDVTATDITGLLNSGYSSFMLKSFDTSHEQAQAVFTHIENNIQYTNHTYLFADGKSLFMLSIDYEQGTIEETLPETCASLYRSFPADTDVSVSEENS